MLLSEIGIVCSCVGSAVLLVLTFLYGDNADRPAEFEYHVESAMLPIAQQRALPTLPARHQKLIVLQWFPFGYSLLQGTSFFGSCGTARCELSTNGSRVSEADAVVFHANGSRRLTEDQTTHQKPRGQLWVFYADASPAYCDGHLFARRSWLDKFDLTLTYRRDSDLFHGFVHAAKKNTNATEIQTDIFRNEMRQLYGKKTKMVAWFANRCVSQSKREIYVRKLQKHIPVDIYGRCGIKCDYGSKCYQNLSKDYMFYLAFENSLCQDYVTEKVITAFRMGGVIPVVRSGADRFLLPPNSVIDARDFSSAKQLSEYLKFVAGNETEYLKYFEWRLHWEVSQPTLPLCELCQRLHSQQRAAAYHDVYRWWVQDMCREPTDIYQS
ncbi:alpha-(1,3)-fucosyltransferase C-like [Physella acuta]|uniref:alpha-(1,3)-fucosyltransferase C-like n=1 Tax=Physella acuta TaxID=109671 RepID=UPI0027DC2500|nr:alpha-(1,3)-fucosyltransferase C-like [Physella acuta]